MLICLTHHLHDIKTPRCRLFVDAGIHPNTNTHAESTTHAYSIQKSACTICACVYFCLLVNRQQEKMSSIDLGLHECHSERQIQSGKKNKNFH